ncbi:MAG: diaminopimelate decarboxylase, partial [Clostridia bacterium]|nr:diaminopimelate decarboxylase [Clostridia bacterium]
SKFGFTLDTGAAESAVQAALSCAHLHLLGLHCHIGSQIFELKPFELAAEVMLEFMAKLHEKYGAEFEELDLGGGFGIKYVQRHDPIAYDEYMHRVSHTIKDCCARLNLRLPRILIEPGRSIVASAGITLYTVGSVKEIPGVRTYVAVDGGMADNPRYSLYQADYDAVIADRAAQPREKIVTIAGRCCETDLLQEGIAIQEAKAGDTLAILATGAYNYSMASNYNRLPRPAVVMVKDAVPRVIVKRESMEQLLANDL